MHSSLRVEMFEVFFPILIKHDKREYYLGGECDLGLHIDYKMKTFDRSNSFIPNITYEQFLKSNVVIEVKADQEPPQGIAGELSEFPQYAQQYSKYLKSLECLWG